MDGRVAADGRKQELPYHTQCVMAWFLVFTKSADEGETNNRIIMPTNQVRAKKNQETWWGEDVVEVSDGGKIRTKDDVMHF